VVGHINKPHGTRGEVFVWVLTDHPDSVFAEGAALHIAGADDRTPDPMQPTLRVRSVRPFRRGLLVGFEGVHDRSGAENLRDRYLLKSFHEVEPVDEDELFYHEILGMKVETQAGEALGEVVELYELRPAHMLEVRGPSGMRLIPFTSRVLVSVDRAARRIVIDPPAGLLDL